MIGEERPAATTQRLPLHDLLLVDPLGPSTRSERRNLLAASVAAILVTQTGLVPHQIQALGIVFDAKDQQVLVWALLAVVLYFLAAYVIYAGGDFLTRLGDKYQATVAMSEQRHRQLYEITESDKSMSALAENARTGGKQYARDAIPLHGSLQPLGRAIAILRFSIDYAFPLVLAFIALWSLATWGPPATSAAANTVPEIRALRTEGPPAGRRSAWTQSAVDWSAVVSLLAATVALGALLLANRARLDPMRVQMLSAQLDHLKRLIPILHRTIVLTSEAQGLKWKQHELDEFREKQRQFVADLHEAVFVGFTFFPTKTANALIEYVNEVDAYLVPGNDAKKATIIGINAKFGAFLNVARAQLGMDKMNRELEQILKAPPDATKERQL
jgi:hypothetical protein